MIKAVIFDLDDTLYDYKALERAAFECVGGLVRERLGVSVEQYEEAFMRARQATKDMLGHLPQQNVVFSKNPGISGYQAAVSGP